MNKYFIYHVIGIREELDDLDSEAAAINRLFAICEGETAFSSDEIDRLLEQYPNAARTLKRCEIESDPMEDDLFGDPVVETYDKYALHVACRNHAPLHVIQALIKAWPDALRAPAGNHLPLHEACTCAKSLPTIQLLVEAWPESIQQCTTDGFGYVAIDLALMASEVSLDIIQFLVQQWPESLQQDRAGYDALKRALACNQPDDIIHYLVQQ